LPVARTPGASTYSFIVKGPLRASASHPPPYAAVDRHGARLDRAPGLSRARRGGGFRRAVRPAAGADPFPHLPAVDGNLFIDLEAQPHLPAVDLDDRHLEHEL